MTRFITVVSGKGGVGRTTVALNLSVAINKLGREAVVLDADLTSPNLGLMLGASNTSINLNHALEGLNHVTEAIYQHNSGVNVITADTSINKTTLIDNLDDTLLDLVGTTDFVIVDSAGGLSKETIHAIKASDEVVVVTTPDLVSVTDALRTIVKSEHLGKHVSGVVINKIRGHENELTTKNIKLLLKKPVIGEIPIDEEVRFSWKAKHPVTHTNPTSKVTNEFKKLANNLITQ